MASEQELLKRITSNPEIFNGKPIIRGMRFKVTDLLGYLASGMTQNEVLHDFPYLEQDDITACLTYAAKKLDHPIISVRVEPD